MVIVSTEESRSHRDVDSGYVPVSDRFMLVENLAFKSHTFDTLCRIHYRFIEFELCVSLFEGLARLLFCVFKLFVFSLFQGFIK